MNIFQLPYETRLQNWYDLKQALKDKPLETKCIEIDKWWQKAPLVNHHLHILDLDNWPSPWELLVENNYCTVARALGICYTLLLIGVNDVKLAEATDVYAEDVTLVLVDNAKYILNYWPDTVISSNLTDFTIKRQIDISKITQKIQ